MKTIFILLFCLIVPFIIAQEYDDEDELDLGDFIGSKKKNEKQEEKQNPQKLENNDKKIKTESEVNKSEPEKSNESKIEDKHEIKEEKKNIKNTNEIFKEDEEDKKSTSLGAVKVDEERTTRYITLSGHLGSSLLFRDDFFSDSTLGNNSTNLDGDFFDPRVMLKIDIQMANNIRGVVEIQNEERNDILHQTSLGNIYITNRTAANQFQFQFEKAFVQVDDFLMKGLKFRTGIIPHKYSLRADGQSFFLNLGEAESPFATRADTHATGFLASYQPIEVVEFYVDAFYFVTSESGFDRRDETVAGINFDIYLPKTVKKDDESTLTLARFFNLMFSSIQSDNGAEIWSIGTGFNYFFTGDPNIYVLETYGEAIFQWGEYNRKNKAPAFSNINQDHLAFGAYVGTKFKYENSDFKPYADLSFWYISGDDDDPKRHKNNDFVSYEDIDSSLIMEENDYGLDVDSNYWSIKFKTGMKLNPIFNEEMRLELLYGHFRAIDSAPGRSKRMGDEIDVRVVWEYSPDLVFSLAAGFLFNSRYMDQLFDEIGARGKSSAFLFRFETMLRF